MKYRYRNPIVDAKLFNGRADCGEAIAKWANSFDGIHANFVPVQEPYDDGEKGCPFHPAHVLVAGPKNSISVTAGNYLIIFPDGDLGMLRHKAFHEEYEVHGNGGILFMPEVLDFGTKNLDVNDFTEKLRREMDRPIFLPHADMTRGLHPTHVTGSFEEADEHGLLDPDDKPEALPEGTIKIDWADPHSYVPGVDPNPTTLLPHWPSPIVEENVDAPSAKPAELEGEDDA